LSASKAEAIGSELAQAILRSGVPTPLAIAALAREPLDQTSKRKAGAYYTDFRLARHLARQVAPCVGPRSTVCDPASGAGILLLALALEASARGTVDMPKWLAENVFAADLSERALRSALVGFAAMCSDIGALRQMHAKWRAQDSLLAGCEVWESVGSGFDVVVANPPWEKVKLSRHEFLRSEGVRRDYGTDYDDFDAKRFEAERESVASYGERLAAKYPSLKGEPDLYVAFTELLIKLAKDGGQVGLIVPAGLIRSQGTSALREHLFGHSKSVSLEVFENRARFFEIDTRFKFLLVNFEKCARSERSSSAIHLVHSEGVTSEISSSPEVEIDLAELVALRSDLSIPEVRAEKDWSIFRSMVANGEDWSQPESAWHPKFMREVDMTRDRGAFERFPAKGSIPLVEGRMVHQHRFGVKSYVCGAGRSATWSPNPAGRSRLDPQFWVRAEALAQRVRERVATVRVGFCDITGQTNERSMLAAQIPAGVVCGNKVPTLTFPNDPRLERLSLWLAIVNSLPFDWALRRVITTTVNYFLLLSIRLPRLEPASVRGRQLADIAAKLQSFDRRGPVSFDEAWEYAELRARADLIVLEAYGLNADALECMLADFPLLDRSQPPILGERQSTVTRDLLLARACGSDVQPWARRLDFARKSGAIPYVPSHLSGVEEQDEGQVAYG
jgi:hypothetical protein